MFNIFIVATQFECGIAEPYIHAYIVQYVLNIFQYSEDSSTLALFVTWKNIQSKDK